MENTSTLWKTVEKKGYEKNQMNITHIHFDVYIVNSVHSIDLQAFK